MDTTTEKIILEKLDKLDNSFEGLKTLIDEEHKKNAVYRYKVDELEKKSEKTNNRQYDWVKTIIGGAIVGIIVFTFGYVVNKMSNSNNVDNKELMNEIRELKKQIK